MNTVFAAGTSVPIDRTQAEIKKTLLKYGATSFAFAEGNGSAMMMFEIQGRRICVKLPMPQNPSDKATNASINTFNQICRSRWRALLLVVKAKLEAVNSKISTLENEFLAFVVLPNGKTVGQEIAPQIESTYKTREMPPLLGMR